MVQIAFQDTEDQGPFGTGTTVVAEDGIAYMAHNFASDRLYLSTWNVSDPSAIANLAYLQLYDSPGAGINLPTNYDRIVKIGGRIFIASGNVIRSATVVNPSTPYLGISLDLGDYIQSIAADPSTRRLFALTESLAGAYTLRVVDIERMVVVGTLTSANFAQNLAAQTSLHHPGVGDVLYLAGSDGVSTIDVSANTPTILDFVAQNNCYNAQTDKTRTRLYVTHSGGGGNFTPASPQLTVYDVSDPSNVSVALTGPDVSFSGWFDLARHGDYLLITNRYNNGTSQFGTVQVADITDPDAPDWGWGSTGTGGIPGTGQSFRHPRVVTSNGAASILVATEDTPARLWSFEMELNFARGWRVGTLS